MAKIAVPDTRGVTHLALLDAALRGHGGPLARKALETQELADRIARLEQRAERK